LSEIQYETKTNGKKRAIFIFEHSPHIVKQAEDIYYRGDATINLLKYGDLSLFLNILSPLEMKIPIDTDTGSNVTGTQAGFGEFIELAVPLMLISDKTGIDVCLSLSLEDGSALIEAMPAEGCYSINLPDEFFELDNWYI
jgi:hypothetical protein